MSFEIEAHTFQVSFPHAFCKQSLGLRSQHRRERRGGEPSAPDRAVHIRAWRDKSLRGQMAMHAIREARALAHEEGASTKELAPAKCA